MAGRGFGQLTLAAGKLQGASASCIGGGVNGNTAASMSATASVNTPNMRITLPLVSITFGCYRVFPV